MINVDVHGSEKAFERIHAVLHGVPGGVKKAMHGVISRATITARATSLKGITQVYDIRPGDVRDRKNSTINVNTKTTDNGVIGMISYSGGKIPLYRFGVAPKQRIPLDYKVPVKIGNIWLMVSPSEAPSARQRKDKAMAKFDGAFIATMSSGHTGIFERKSRSSSKISEIMGASTPQMVENSVVLSEVEAATFDAINKRAEYEISRILNGYT